MTSTGHRSLARADRLLDHVARSATAPTLTDLARAIGAPVSSTQDLVRELCVLGYLRVVDSRYRTGLRMHVLTVVAGAPSTAGVDHDDLVRLSRLVQAPVTLAALVGREVFYLDHAGPRAPTRLQVVADDHRPRPTLRTAAGRLLLALCDEPVRRRILGELAVADPVAARAFATELPLIRRHRIARSDGLADPDIAAVALPTTQPDIALMVTARRAPRGGRVPVLERAAQTLRAEIDQRGADTSEVPGTR
ncbi:helix-turn-helix domain-containing protein [Williamsia herbipolensis]|uniref:helix-turn-helix domain-containing protein n=1 Tax=Williamsia herbipolensis TaxID=1603258 RepID=UPI0005F80595|nr:helix-turn-helix domain-containing protein [Williamsia herbipolensis]